MIDGDGSDVAIANSINQHGLDWLWQAAQEETCHIDKAQTNYWDSSNN